MSLMTIIREMKVSLKEKTVSLLFNKYSVPFKCKYYFIIFDLEKPFR